MKNDTPYEFWGADCSKCTKGNDCWNKDLLESKYGYVFNGYPDEACSVFVRKGGEVTDNE